MKTTTTLITDDVDGQPGARPVTIAVDGSHYEIDLTETNISRLYETLSPYLDKSRPLRPHRQRGPHKTAAASNPASIRQWWKNHPDTLPTWQARGAIPHTVLRAYQQANG